ncbi:TonB-dependent receptor plug domain-containing protein [Microbulbifer hydrolyticus]|uniref:Iron complex outermembrane receptor protein n=1 Tax=Microbulbifer hydrolyticus TaxID=48074 RepID=A0A6P1TGQ9_9GAMM|nr:TonB-dependent receptor [Microbulbifer hydrolyticus]MBB5212350.1 iron complex outermembrane receptor protein [Microbulbifer hydrolyticus]QHQ39992.1 TonB-dependent receptor [Microbulbifer hydrolyticus]
MDKTRLSRAIKGAIAAAAVTSSFSTVTIAQDVQAQVEEIVVTGSRIQRATDANSATPISVFDAAQLEQSGQTTLEDFLQDIPSMTGGQLGSSVNNGSAGLATVSLRGLGSSRTLILMNGRRLSSSGGATGVVDLNTIPTSIIERVEILRDGASTIYGSDAIAGVINIITKKGFEGAELTFDYGSSTHGDGDEYLAAMTLGASNDRGHVMLNAQYTKRDEIGQGDRRFSECPLREIGGNVVCGGSATTTPARFSPTANSDQLIVDPITGEVRDFNAATDAYNFAAVSYLITPQEVASMYGYGTYELYDWKDVTTFNAFSELSFVNRRSDQLLAAEGTFWGPEVPITSPYNPIGEPVNIGRRLEETGGRAFSQDLNTWRGVVGLEGEFCNEWTWDLSYNYSRWVDTQIDRGRGNTVRFQNLLDPVACAADEECSAALADSGGVPAWNPFVEGSLTPAMQDYALVTNSPVERSNLRSFQANLVGDFGDWSLASEAPQWAVGYENRAERAEIVPDGAAQIGQIYFVSGDAWGGNYSVDEFYGEVRVPILDGRPWAQVLAFEASFRYSDYSTIGDDTTFGVVLEYAPLDQLRFRGTYSEGFRAPGLDDLFLPPTVSAETYADPCNEYGAGDNANVIANCQADGIAPGTTIASTQATGLFGGNPDLEAEKSESWTLGIVWTPTWTDDLGFTVDYFDISIDDAIGTLTTNTIVQGCYESANFSSPLCDLITGAPAVGTSPSQGAPTRRASDLTIAGQLLNSQNVATFETSGVDLGFDYSIDAGPGVVTVNATATYLHEWKYRGSSEDPTVDLAGYFGADPVTTAIVAFPEWKFYGTVGYEYDCWSAFTTVRMLGEVDDFDPSPGDLATHIDTTWYQDVNFNYFRWENVTLTGGIRNVWNQQPPYVTNNDDMNTLMRSYDTVGRFFYGSVSLKF